jgi:hypothetical protein
MILGCARVSTENGVSQVKQLCAAWVEKVFL